MTHKRWNIGRHSVPDFGQVPTLLVTFTYHLAQRLPRFIGEHRVSVRGLVNLR
jgi:hypothetical protein